MFKYNKKIDKWSHKITKNVECAWGINIEKKMSKFPLVTPSYLIKFLNDYLKSYGNIILGRFNDITGLRFKLNDIGFYINTTAMSMHNGKDCYVSIGLNHAFISYPTILIHEIFHIYFSRYVYSSKFLESNNIARTAELISMREENEIKEIITIIINELFADIIDVPDYGYPDHKDIRDKILARWKTKKDINFHSWFISVISLYKKVVAT